MPIIKIKDDRHGRFFRTGVNGRVFMLPVDKDIEVDDSLLDHLKGMDVDLEEASTRAGSSSKEGSVEVEPAYKFTGEVDNISRDAKLSDARVTEEIALQNTIDQMAAEVETSTADHLPDTAPKAPAKKAAAKAAKKK